MALLQGRGLLPTQSICRHGSVVEVVGVRSCPAQDNAKQGGLMELAGGYRAHPGQQVVQMSMLHTT